jgi:hypothetical protein
VHQVQVNIVGLQVLEGVVNGLRDTLVPGVVELGGEPKLGTGNTGVLDAVADFLLVFVGGGSINVAVAVLESNLDGVADLVGLGLPGSQADGGDGGAGVELERLAVAVLDVDSFDLEPVRLNVHLRGSHDESLHSNCL